MGRGSQVSADIHAQDVVFMGSVKGSIFCTELLDARSESSIQGEIVTRRIRIEPPKAKAAAAPAGEAAKQPAPVPRAAQEASESVKRAPGSSGLFKPVG